MIADRDAKEAIIELAKRVDECVVALTNELSPTIRTGAREGPVPMAIAKLQAFIDDLDPVQLDDPDADGDISISRCSYWPTGRHVFRGHTDGSTDPCRCGAKWNGPKPAIPPDPRRPERRDGTTPRPLKPSPIEPDRRPRGKTVTVVDEAHEHEQCPECGGDGLARVAASQGACPRCDGSGKVPLHSTSVFEDVGLGTCQHDDGCLRGARTVQNGWKLCWDHAAHPKGDPDDVTPGGSP